MKVGRENFLLSMAYLPGAQRISVILVKGKDLPLTSTDKEVLARITLIYRDEEQKSLFGNLVPMTTDPSFNEEFIFHLSEFRSVSIDGIVISVELQSKQTKRFAKPRELGKVTVGNSASVSQIGKEHWATMLTSTFVYVYVACSNGRRFGLDSIIPY